MGQYVSKIKGHYVTRNLQRFNIESRTNKILKAEKPKVAPRYPSDEKARQDVLRNMPDQTGNEIHNKSSELHSRLKHVYVTSTDPAVDKGYDPDINRRRPEHPDRPLPRARTIRGIDRSAFAVDESRTNVPKGKITLEKVQEMIASHRVDQEKNTPTVLAQYYSMDLAQTESVLEHFRVFGHVKGKQFSAKERQDREDPYRAQPDWVEAAGEHPPLITDDKLPRAGVMPEINLPAKPLLIKDNQISITAGNESSKEKLVSGKEQVKLKDINKDDTK